MERTFFFLLIFVLSGQITFGQKSFYFDGKEVKPKTKQHFSIPIINGEDSTLLPVSVFNGIAEGPVLGITAGVHGYEYPPIIAAQKLIKSINPETLKGVVILVQISNPEGFSKRTPYLNPQDGKNLNRVFPGSNQGTITEKIAHFITQNVIAKSDFFLDMHCGDAPEDLMSYSAYYSNESMPAVSNKGKEMAVSLDYDHVVVFNTKGKKYMEKQEPSLYCSAEAFKRGKPAVDIECGRLGVADPQLIDKIESGVLNLLEYLEMLPASGEKQPAKAPLMITERHYVSAKHSGIFYPEKVSGEYVAEGMKIGYITNYFGEVIEPVYASENGIILLIIGTPPISTDETIAVIGKVD
ncbi:succinylglutamate desuccinylase/aspartoacylase family protein [Flexithrix dorotheae]|uniref:succinylglutamate desuccinylase/aspartoacylase family protein n=1 Tax=Flexithrix dorotheae TaxID=70993 RepID=UPI000380D7C0|nr:M14 family metallopeptidase [Flexithrix dorotheae]